MNNRNQFLAKISEKNLCSWYILPLIDLNLLSFPESNFVNSYLVKDAQKIAVQVIDINLCMHLFDHPMHVQTIAHGEGELLVFDIPESWSTDYKRFVEGKYSKMTAYAKDKIREKSGLKYEVLNDRGEKITDAILMALDKHPALVNKWLDVLGPTELPEELMSIPGEESYVIL